ncbi:MAG: hypothetical protein HYY06_14540 [Deltaproteobacteria bacterium]|nr:hypothetical protein [Deltaproteobacteria bacterium]
MKRLVIALGFVGATLLVSASALAQQQPAQGGGGGGVAQTTTYDFEDDIVQGDLVRPDGEMALARRRGRQSSLIRVREHFVPEMLKSVENL